MSSDFSQEIDYQVYAVAVDFNPTIWAVECELCGEILKERTSGEAEVGRLEFSHKAFHAGMSVVEYKLSRRMGKEK